MALSDRELLLAVWRETGSNPDLLADQLTEYRAVATESAEEMRERVAAVVQRDGPHLMERAACMRLLHAIRALPIDPVRKGQDVP